MIQRARAMTDYLMQAGLIPPAPASEGNRVLSRSSSWQ